MTLRYRWYLNTNGMSVRLSRSEQREQTRDAIADAAERLFTEHGFHATSLDQIAAAAGFTKGAVYSNFSSKEDLFFAVYERRAARTLAHIERILAMAPDPVAGAEAVADAFTSRRHGSDGWLAVFFEFWAHVIRRPELRERFAEVHARGRRPFAELIERHAANSRVELPLGAEQLSVAMGAMQFGLQLERLTQPDVVDAGLGARMARMGLEDLVRRTGRKA